MKCAASVFLESNDSVPHSFPKQFVLPISLSFSLSLNFKQRNPCHPVHLPPTTTSAKAKFCTGHTFHTLVKANSILLLGWQGRKTGREPGGLLPSPCSILLISQLENRGFNDDLMNVAAGSGRAERWDGEKGRLGAPSEPPGACASSSRGSSARRLQAQHEEAEPSGF